MTNQEYLLSLLGFAPPVNSIEGALTDAGIDATGTYTSTNSTDLKKAAVWLLQLLLSTADTTQGTGETAFAVKYDRAAIEKRIQLLNEDLGLTDGIPTIDSKKAW